MKKTLTPMLLGTILALSSGCTEKMVEEKDFDHDGIQDRLCTSMGQYYILWGQKSDAELRYVGSVTLDALTAGKIENVTGHAYENYQIFESNKRGKSQSYIQTNLNGGKDWGTYAPYEKINENTKICSR
jgi:hypothetical protein